MRKELFWTGFIVAVCAAVVICTGCGGEEPTTILDPPVTVKAPEQPGTTTGHTVTDALEIEFVQFSETYTVGWQGALGVFQLKTAAPSPTITVMTIQVRQGRSTMPFADVYAAHLDGIIVSELGQPNTTTNYIQVALDYTPGTPADYLYLMSRIPEGMLMGAYDVAVSVQGSAEKGGFIKTFFTTLIIIE